MPFWIALNAGNGQGCRQCIRHDGYCGHHNTTARRPNGSVLVADDTSPNYPAGTLHALGATTQAEEQAAEAAGQPPADQADHGDDQFDDAEEAPPAFDEHDHALIDEGGDDSDVEEIQGPNGPDQFANAIAQLRDAAAAGALPPVPPVIQAAGNGGINPAPGGGGGAAGAAAAAAGGVYMSPVVHQGVGSGNAAIAGGIIGPDVKENPEAKYGGIPVAKLEMLLERGYVPGSGVVPTGEALVLKNLITKLRASESQWDPRVAIEELLNPDEPNPILRAGRTFEQAQMGAPPRQIHKRVREVFETGYGTRRDQYDDAGYVPDRESGRNPLIRNIDRADSYYESGMPDMQTLYYRTLLQDRDAVRAQRKIAADTTRAYVRQSMKDASVYAEAPRNAHLTRHDDIFQHNEPAARVDPHVDVQVSNSDDVWVSALFRR